MAIEIGQNIGNGVFLGTSSTDLFTVGATILRAQVSQARLVNSGSVPVDVTIWILQASESQANEKKAIVTKTLAVGETYNMPEIIGEGINSTGKIQGLASVVTSVSFSGTANFITS